MTNVLLTKIYKSRPVGTILKDVSDGEAAAIEAMGLGEKLPADEPEKPAKKGEKATSSE
ncbi:hypothetical protein [Shinella sp.]|uniref:hypothetical protein n=1 Tax=Shinella sp. TaxID=1870904 RepID=UPI00289F4D88|nr:hypothetical protein [Shinella sp.]